MCITKTKNKHMKYINLKTLFTILIIAVSISKSEAISSPKNIIEHAIYLPTKDSSTKTDSAYNKALEEFKNLSKAEKKQRTKEAKKMLKEYKKNKKDGDVKDKDILMAILCILLPPVAVYLHQNKETTTKFWISLILTLLFWVPGIIYALLVVFGNL